MKKFITLIISVLLLLTAVFAVGCSDKSDNGPKKLTFIAPDGAPALAIAKFINDGENFGMDGEITYKVVSSSNIGPAMTKGEGDFIVMPVNAASKLYKANESSPYVCVAVITHGNLYLMSSDGSSTLDDLKGKVVGVIGRGLVPDLTFKAILSDKGLLSDVVEGETATDGKITLRYFQSAPDMIPMLKQGTLSVGLLPEPACTNLTKVASNREWTRMDVQELYDGQLKSYPQAVLMVRKSLYEPFKDGIENMKNLFGNNIEWIKQNTATAVAAVNAKLAEGVTASLVSANITANVVDNCKIYFEDGESMKTAVKTYIDKIISVEQTSAKAISDDFFA
jgi:NitT/TauT family transport system substrate-binding protein